MSDRVVVFQDQNDEWRWHRVAANNEVIATSGEGYKNKEHAVEMAARVNENAELVIQDETA